MTRRVLVIHSRVGGGHLSAARALAAALDATGEARTRLVDVYLDCGRFPATLFPSMYARLTRHAPLGWALLYHGTSRRLDTTRLLRPLVASGLRRVLADDQSDMVVSVVPMVNGVLSRLAKPARLEVVFTDWHAVHPFWLAPGVDHYTAATESARQACVDMGVPAEAVDVVGLPVRPEFAAGQPADPSAFGLEPGRFTVLVMVGAEGSLRTVRNLRYLVRHLVESQVLVVCGRNTALRRRVEALPSRVPLRALGFVENVAGLMRAADVLVTKAGGLTLAEAFCCEVPVVVHDLLPGQEAGNLAYALQHQAVLYAPRPASLAATVTALQADPERRSALAARARRLVRTDAAARIASAILDRAAVGGALA